MLGEGVDLVIHADDAALESMPEVVREMHGKSGLTEEVRRSVVTMAEAEEAVLAYVKEHVPNPRTAPLCGNSIATDRGFLARDMPTLDNYLHYRMIDVSSIKELCRRWYPRVYFGQPAKGLAHRALADIRESIRELEYYRRTVFVPPPGPDVEQARRSLPSCRSRRHWPNPVDRSPWLVAMIVRRRGVRPARRDGGRSSAGRAPGCGPGGRGFKSRRSPHRKGSCPRMGAFFISVSRPVT